jgi:hypothetical protein
VVLCVRSTSMLRENVDVVRMILASPSVARAEEHGTTALRVTPTSSLSSRSTNILKSRVVNYESLLKLRK